MKINGFVPDSKIFDTIKPLQVATNEGNKNDFLSMLKEKLDGVNDNQITAEEAKMSLELAVQIRNKLVEAYQELNRMQL
jgi:flagellar hook-basal body complex protein FliE